VNPVVTTDEVVNVCGGYEYQVPVVVAAAAEDTIRLATIRTAIVKLIKRFMH
jgi:hypothetical protein